MIEISEAVLKAFYDAALKEHTSDCTVAGLAAAFEATLREQVAGKSVTELCNAGSDVDAWWYHLCQENMTDREFATKFRALLLTFFGVEGAE